MRFEKTVMATTLAALLAIPTSAAANEVDELKAQIRQLMERIEKLEELERAEHSDPAGVDRARVASGRPAVNGNGVEKAPWKPTVLSGNDNVRVSLSGHINRAILAYDDGENSDIEHVDNENSNTRFRIVGEYDASETLTVGTVMEVEFESNSSSDVTQDSGSGDDSESNFQQRKFELFFADDRWGKLSLGQGDMASNGSSEEDLSGTGLAGYSSVGDVATSLKFFDDDTGSLATATVGSGFTNMDGLSRLDRIRYDTPKMGGFILSVSHANEDAMDAAVRYSADYQGTKVAAALAYAKPSSNSIDGQINGSVSVLMPSGLNLTFAAGEQDKEGVSDSDDPSFFYTKLGYKMGKSAYSVDYYSSWDVTTSGDEGDSIGFQYARDIPEWATEAYFQLRQFDLDRSGADFDEILTLMAGARVKF